MPEIRYQVAMAAAEQIIKLLDPCFSNDPVRFGTIAYLVLEALYECESRLADEQPKFVLCLHCHRSLRLVPEIPSWNVDCPECGRYLRPAESAFSN